MTKQAKRLQLLSVVLCIFVALLFSLTWVPNVIHVNTVEGFFPSNYYNLMGNDIFNILSGILLGGSLIPLIMFATRPSYRLISVSAVMLEIAVFFGLFQFVSAYLYPPGSYTPLGHMIEAGALFATVFAFLLAAMSAASLHTLAMSAPEKPGV